MSGFNDNLTGFYSCEYSTYGSNNAGGTVSSTALSPGIYLCIFGQNNGLSTSSAYEFLAVFSDKIVEISNAGPYNWNFNTTTKIMKYTIGSSANGYIYRIICLGKF